MPAFCAQCGKPLTPGAAFCAQCGAAVAIPLLPPERRPALPVPDLSRLHGPCAILRCGGGEPDIRAMGRLVAEATKTPLPDVTRFLRNSKGIVALSLPKDQALDLARRLEKELRESVLVLPMADMAPLPPVMRMRKIAADAAGLKCEAYTWDSSEALEFSWREVFLISVGRVEQKDVSESPEDEPRPEFMPRLPKLITHTRYECLLDIVVSSDGEGKATESGVAHQGARYRRLRMDENTAGFAFTGIPEDPSSALARLVRAAMHLERVSVGVPRNRGLGLLASGAPDYEWQGLTFLTKRDFDSYTHWLMQLVRHGQGIPA